MGKSQKGQKIVYGKAKKPAGQHQASPVAPITAARPRTADLLKMDINKLKEMVPTPAPSPKPVPESMTEKDNTAKQSAPKEKKPEKQVKSIKPAKKAKKSAKTKENKVNRIVKPAPLPPENIESDVLAHRMMYKWGHIALVVHHDLPLAIGAGEELIAVIREGLVANNYVSNPSRSTVRKMMRIWMGRKSYQARLATPGGLRYYPDLRVAGPVSEDHRAVARDRLKTRYRLSDVQIDALIDAVKNGTYEEPRISLTKRRKRMKKRAADALS
jgi:hypothetical protein